MKTITRAVAAVTAIAGTTLAAAGPAHAVPSDVVFVDKFDETFSDDGFASFLEAGCNVADVHVEVRAKGRVQVYEDGATGFESGTARAVNTETGEYFVQTYHNHFSFESSETIREDGLHEVEIHEVYRGLAEQFRAPGLGVVVRDAGNIAVDVELLIDPTADPEEQIREVVETFTIKGPHPWAEQGFGPTAEQAIAICGAIGGAPSLP